LGKVLGFFAEGYRADPAAELHYSSDSSYWSKSTAVDNLLIFVPPFAFHRFFALDFRTASAWYSLRHFSHIVPFTDTKVAPHLHVRSFAIITRFGFTSIVLPWCFFIGGFA
jgi:hypothetical protein